MAVSVEPAREHVRRAGPPATDAELARGSAQVVDGQVRIGSRPATLRRRLAAIEMIHRAAGHDDPTAH
jgi:hypothetical protein